MIMKSKTFILCTIGIISVIVAALAFKANKLLESYYSTTTTSTLNADGSPVTCTMRDTTGPLGPTLGCCTFIPGTGAACCGSRTRWTPNQ